MLFPQTEGVVPLQVKLHLFGSPLSAPSSQVSPAAAFTVPSPQDAALQSASHDIDSPLSSHSSPTSMAPLPQTGGLGSNVTVVALLPPGPIGNK